MKPIRYVVGAISFLLVWLMVAIVVGFGISILFPPTNGMFTVGIGLDWRNLPGTILGVLAGVQSFRRSIQEPAKKEKAPPDK